MLARISQACRGNGCSSESVCTYDIVPKLSKQKTLPVGLRQGDFYFYFLSHFAALFYDKPCAV